MPWNTTITGDDIITATLDNQSRIPTVSGIIGFAQQKSSALVNLTDYIGGWNEFEFDPEIKSSFTFVRDLDKSKIIMSNTPSKVGVLPSQSYKLNFTSGDKSTTFSGTANISNDRPTYTSAAGYPKNWQGTTSFSYKTNSGTSDKSDDITATSTNQVTGNSNFTENTNSPGLYTGWTWQSVNSNQSYKVGAISLIDKHVWTGNITLNETNQIWKNSVIINEYRFSDNSDPSASFGLSYKGTIKTEITFTDYNNLANNTGTIDYNLTDIVVSDTDKNFSMTTKKAIFSTTFNGDETNLAQRADDYELIKEDFYGDIFNNNGQQEKSLAYNILKNDNVYKSTQTSSNDGSTGSFIFTLDGKDNITGSKFDDFIMAGRDADIMKGGAGADTFSFSEYDLNAYGGTPQRMQMDIVSDFKRGVDKIYVTNDAGDALIYDALGTKAQGTMWFDQGTLWMNFNRDPGFADAGVVLAGVKTFGQSDLGVTSSWTGVFPG